METGDRHTERQSTTPGEIAHEAIKRHFPSLMKVVATGDIVPHLYSKGMLDESTFDIVTSPNATISSSQKGTIILKSVQSSVQVKPEKFDTFCRILKSEGDQSDLADELTETMKDLTIEEEDVEKDMPVEKKSAELHGASSESVKVTTEKHEKVICGKISVEFQQLKEELELYKKVSARPDPPDNINDCIEKAIHYHIETSYEAGIPVETLKEQVQTLNDPECLITAETCRWALKEIDTVWKNGRSSKCMALLPKELSLRAVQPPSLSPFLLYHALLCSKAVSTCSNTKAVHDFFSQVGHKLEEASLSLRGENVNQYMMAKNGDTFYIAFQSEASITQWLSVHNTFEEGLDLQTKRVPLSFFIEQILKEKKIVLTGFSFGGLLACYIAAYIWRASCLDVIRLQKNIMCITFGQPLFSIPYVQEMIQIYPAFEQTLHLILDKEDIVPPILCYFGIGCILKSHALSKSASIQVKSTANSSDPDKLKTDFRGKFSSVLLSSLASLQDTLQKKPLYSSAVQKSSPTSISTQSPLSKLKELLDELVNLDAETKIESSLLSGNVYLMKFEGIRGLVWKGMITKKVVKDELLSLKRLIEKIDINLFKKHNIDEYCSKTLRCHLEKEHSDIIPMASSTKSSLREVGILQPRADLVEFHMYPDEYVIVLEGNNLWFCHKIHLGEDEKVIESDLATNIMRRKIEFRFPPSPNIESIADHEGVSIKLYSHFAEPVGTQVQAKEESYPFSLRQIQLAKHTPTEIIQLAYCTAMLERPQVCGDQDQPMTSERFEAVKYFLEEAAKIVPLESVLYAIAYSDKDTAIQCAKALKASDLQLPLSEMMLTGSRDAADRVCLGLTREEYLENSQKQAWQSLDDFLDLPLSDPDLPSQLLPPDLPPLSDLPFSPLPVMQRPQLDSPPRPKRPPKRNSRQSYSDVTRRSRRSSPQVHQEVISVSLIPIPIPVPTPVITAIPLDQELAVYMDKLRKDLGTKCQGKNLMIISKKSIEHFCPFGPRRQTLKERQLRSPLQALKEAREQLMSFVETSEIDAADQENTLAINAEMLRIVRNIQDQNLKTCAALLAAFMEQTIRIPMLKSNIDTAKFLSSEQASVAMGTWAFISMGFDNIEKILSSSEGSSLIVEVEDYIMGVHELSKKLSCKSEEQSRPTKSSDRKYAAKLNFLVNGIRKNTGGKSVTCSTQYISYSLEHHLFKLSQQLHFNKSLSVKQLVEKWDSTFKDDALLLVAKSHRPLIARWLKWALLVHDLRETLASYTSVGVIGLSNSGKSLLVNSLFDIQTQVGTTEKKRTVVPFIYNMDGRVDKLDVIDFPGVDDKESVPELAKLLVGLAQVVLFIVNYRNISNETVREWLKELEKEDQIHVHVCLTHSDWLYRELERKEAANKPKMTLLIKQELTMICEKVGHHPSRSMRFYCFDASDIQQNLTLDTLREVGVYSSKDVGEWLVQTIDDKLAQSDLADNLKRFFNNKVN